MGMERPVNREAKAAVPNRKPSYRRISDVEVDTGTYLIGLNSVSACVRFIGRCRSIEATYPLRMSEGSAAVSAVAIARRRFFWNGAVLTM